MASLLSFKTTDDSWKGALEDLDNLAYDLGSRYQQLVDLTKTAAFDQNLNSDYAMMDDFLRHALYTVSKLIRRLDIWRTRISLSAIANDLPMHAPTARCFPSTSSQGGRNGRENLGPDSQSNNSILNNVLSNIAEATVCATMIEARLCRCRHKAAKMVYHTHGAAVLATISAGQRQMTTDHVDGAAIIAAAVSAADHNDFVHDVRAFTAAARTGFRAWEEARGVHLMDGDGDKEIPEDEDDMQKMAVLERAVTSRLSHAEIAAVGSDVTGSHGTTGHGIQTKDFAMTSFSLREDSDDIEMETMS